MEYIRPGPSIRYKAMGGLLSVIRPGPYMRGNTVKAKTSESTAFDNKHAKRQDLKKQRNFDTPPYIRPTWALYTEGCQDFRILKTAKVFGYKARALYPI